MRNVGELQTKNEFIRKCFGVVNKRNYFKPGNSRVSWLLENSRISHNTFPVSINDQLLVDLEEKTVERVAGSVTWLPLLTTWLLATLNFPSSPYCRQGD